MLEYLIEIEEQTVQCIFISGESNISLSVGESPLVRSDKKTSSSLVFERKRKTQHACTGLRLSQGRGKFRGYSNSYVFGGIRKNRERFLSRIFIGLLPEIDWSGGEKVLHEVNGSRFGKKLSIDDFFLSIQIEKTYLSDELKRGF